MTQYAEEWYTNMFGNTFLSEYGARVKEQELNLGRVDFVDFVAFFMMALW